MAVWKAAVPLSAVHTTRERKVAKSYVIHTLVCFGLKGKEERKGNQEMI